MLNRTGYADRDIQLGRNYFAGLTDLIIVGRIFGINGRTGRAYCRTQNIGQRGQYGIKILFAAQTLATGHHYTRLCQFGTF